MDDHPENKINILCLGPKSSGKTMLMKRLQNVEGIDKTYSSVPTIGTNIYDIHYKNKAGKRLSLLIREVGGEMAPLWSSYLDHINKFLLVLAKMDVAYRQMRNEALLMLQFKRLNHEVPQPIAVLETSAIDGEGVDKLKEWITGIKIPDDTLVK